MNPDPSWADYKGMFVRNDHDLKVVSEVMTDDCYRMRRWPLQPGSFIVDCGGHIGSFTRHLAGMCQDIRAVIVEQAAENRAIIEANVKPHIVQCSVVTGVVVYESEDWEWPTGKPSITPESVMKSAGEKYIDILKLDIEGFEWNVLNNIAQRVMTNIGVVVGEYHNGPFGDCDDEAVGFLQKIHRERWSDTHRLQWDRSKSVFWLWNPTFWRVKECGG